MSLGCRHGRGEGFYSVGRRMRRLESLATAELVLLGRREDCHHLRMTSIFWRGMGLVIFGAAGRAGGSGSHCIRNWFRHHGEEKEWMTCPCRRRRGSGSIIFIVIIEIFDSIRTCGARSSFDSSFIDHSDFVQAREEQSFRRGILIPDEARD